MLSSTHPHTWPFLATFWVSTLFWLRGCWRLNFPNSYKEKPRPVCRNRKRGGGGATLAPVFKVDLKCPSYRAARWCWWCASCWTTPRRDARPRRCTFLRPGRSPSSASAWRKAGSSRHPERERESNGDTQQSVGESDKREAEQNRTNIFDWLDCGLKRINKVWQITIILSRELESTRCWSVNERDTRERRGRKCCFGRVVRNVKKRDRVTGQETLATSATQIERQKYLPVPGPRRTVPPKSQMKCIYLSSNPSDWTHIDTSQ